MCPIERVPPITVRHGQSPQVRLAAGGVEARVLRDICVHIGCAPAEAGPSARLQVEVVASKVEARLVKEAECVDLIGVGVGLGYQGPAMREAVSLTIEPTARTALERSSSGPRGAA